MVCSFKLKENIFEHLVNMLFLIMNYKGAQIMGILSRFFKKLVCEFNSFALWLRMLLL